MKKAFTLIELLVVIAIIAILAAILFPVFAQAKLAAKKAVSISNQKQIGLSIIMYTGDWDDTFPREDNCVLNQSLNPALNNVAAGSDPSPECDGSVSYAFRLNHYAWQAWVLPYVKSVGLFFHPVIQKDPTSWNNDGNIFGGYALNLGLTGATNTWGMSTGELRNSVVGGTTTAVAQPANAMIVMEQAAADDPAVGTIDVSNGSSGSNTVYSAYPLAVREYWAGQLYSQQAGSSAPCGNGTTVDPVAVPFGTVIPMSYVDGHTAALAVGQFLAETPASSDLGYGGYALGSCGSHMDYQLSQAPKWTQPWPLWGLQ